MPSVNNTMDQPCIYCVVYSFTQSVDLWIMKTQNWSMSLVLHYCISEPSAPAAPLLSKSYKAISKEAGKLKATSVLDSVRRSSK